MKPFVTSDTDEVLRRLNNGDVVALPTETVYGLAGRIDREDSLKKIFSLKSRPFFDPLIVHVANIEQAKELSRYWTPLANFLAKTFWPGPLTLVVPKAASVNSLITSGLDTVAIRWPAHPLAQEILSRVGAPLAAPSANQFGKTSPTKAAHVAEEFAFDDLLILEGGPCTIGVESTVVMIPQSSDSMILEILRPGGITPEDLQVALKSWEGAPLSIEIRTRENSPGHLQHHYMPQIPLYFFSSRSPASENQFKRKTQGLKIAEIDLPDDPRLAARVLYSELRAKGTSGAQALVIFKRSAQTGGLWLAIWDRVEKAATSL